MKKLTLLGVGQVGSAIARDCVSPFHVTAVDVSTDALNRLPEPIQRRQADLSNPDVIKDVVADADIVIGAVPGCMGYQTLRAVIEAGKPVVDISFFEEDPFTLDALAKERGVVAVIDCGVAPGMSNMVLGHWETTFERLDTFVCYVGGILETPQAGWNYKAPYSPGDVVEMYTRPARMRRGGEDVTLPALTDHELIEFPNLTLEAFNTDGLRTPLVTSKTPNMVEKTLRYPGHMDHVCLFRDSGFFGTEPIQTASGSVTPLDLSTRLLVDTWRPGPQDYDLTVMRLVGEGVKDGAPHRVVCDLIDHYDREQDISSMARVTAYPCTAAARLVADGTYAQPGISPPEFLGRERACFDAVIRDLSARKVDYRGLD